MPFSRCVPIECKLSFDGVILEANLIKLKYYAKKKKNCFSITICAVLKNMYTKSLILLCGA